MTAGSDWFSGEVEVLPQTRDVPVLDQQAASSPRHVPSSSVVIRGHDGCIGYLKCVCVCVCVCVRVCVVTWCGVIIQQSAVSCRLARALRENRKCHNTHVCPCQIPLQTEDRTPVSLRQIILLSFRPAKATTGCHGDGCSDSYCSLIGLLLRGHAQTGSRCICVYVCLTCVLMCVFERGGEVELLTAPVCHSGDILSHSRGQTEGGQQ